MADFLTKLIADLQDASTVKKGKTKKNAVSVRFVDMVGNGLEGLKLTPEIARGHADEVLKSNPLVKSVLSQRKSASSPQSEPESTDDNRSRLTKSVMNILDAGGSIERLAFEVNPAANNTYQSLYRRKLRLLPDEVLKRIALQDDLVAAIVNTRSQMVSAFGRPQPDRFSTGYRIEAEPGIVEKLSSDEKEALQKQIERAEALLLTCGQTKGWTDHDALTFGQYLFQQARNAVVFGRCATELVYVTDAGSGDRKFHSFRPIDAGTIYRASPFKTQAQHVRDAAINLLSTLKNKKLRPEKYIQDEYVWVQVIEGRPIQAFTDEECVVHNFYPIADIELEGYPLTPLDTVISAVTTHINITTHNKLYFQSGRAARGMLVFKTDDIDEADIDPIRQQFNATINGVGNAWHMPVFRVGSTDDVTWSPIDNSSRDMEFQYLSDTNARVILSAFQMSPEELPGYAHLSRGTNNQALSESNNEYKLEAHRDVGIRPLIAQMQNYVNERIFPLIDEDLSKKASVKFVGLDVDTAEKESVRLQQDMAVHMTMDEVLDKVEKKPVGKAWGGQFLLNPQWQKALYENRTRGEIMEEFFGVEGASKDPRFAYLPGDPMFLQWNEMLMQQQQMQQQAQAQQQQQQQAQQQGQEDQGDLANSTDQLIQLMSKSEAQLPASKRRLLLHQRKVIAQALEAFESDSKAVIEEILSDAEKLSPRK